MSSNHEQHAGGGTSSRAHLLVMVLLLLLGALFRLRGLGGQIPIDDEWHGLDFALTRSVWFLFTHFSRAGANSVPFNLYLRTMLDSFGWNEVSIALPSLLAGVALLWIFPRWVSRRFGVGAGAATAALLALSPFLIFYSRVARAYSVVVLLECLSLVALCEWLRTARRRHAIELALYGGLAIWTHASALPPLAAALAAAAGHRWLRSRKARTPALPPAWQVVAAGLATLGLAGALWLPALRTPMPVMWHAPAHFSARTLWGVVELLSGTDAASLQVIYWVLAVTGVVLAARSARQEMVVLGAAAAGCLFAVLLTRPNAGGVAGVFVRYLLPVFLLASLAIGVAIQSAVRAAATRASQRLLVGAAIGLGVALFALGPLPRLHDASNSFTKHPTFQFDYGEHDPDRARPDPLDPGAPAGLHRAELQPFYAQLSREAGTAPVIEYPFVLGEDANVLYFAQQVHARPVLAGYYRSGALDQDVFGIAVGPRASTDRRPPSPGYITSGMMVDHVLGRPESDGRIHLRTVVDIADPDAVFRSQAQYLILHWNPLREFFHIGPAWGRSRFVDRIRKQLLDRYGAPAFENGSICVFRLTGAR